jgi:hypothetical protein
VIPEPTPHPKLIYFAERRAGLDHTGFVARWRQHAKLGMSMPRWRNVLRYAHCDSVDVKTGLPVACCDGVATVSYRSEESRLAHVSDKSAGPAMKQDEQETFARPVREVAVLTEEHRFVEDTPARRKLFLRVWAKPGVPRADLRSWWLEGYASEFLRRLEASAACRGYSQNHARGENSGEGVPPPLCDVVDELATDDHAAASTAVLETLKSLPEAVGLVGEVKAVWTEETLLHGR